jgi:hypothetical protein
VVAEVGAGVIDRRGRRRRAEEGLEGLSDDEVSPLPYTRDDVRASRLDEDED